MLIEIVATCQQMTSEEWLLDQQNQEFLATGKFLTRQDLLDCMFEAFVAGQWVRVAR